MEANDEGSDLSEQIQWGLKFLGNLCWGLKIKIIINSTFNVLNVHMHRDCERIPHGESTLSMILYCYSFQ